MNIYDVEDALKGKLKNSSEDLLRYAILETITPIADYSYAINVISEYYANYQDLRLFIVASYLSSTWENYKSNAFLEELNEFIPTATNQQKSIIYYLNAYDIFMHCQHLENQKKYIDFLKKSVDLSEKFFYNRYYLAKISEKTTQKILIKQGLSKVEKVWTEVELEKIKIEDLITYEAFLNEHILGIWLSEVNYSEIKDLLR